MRTPVSSCVQDSFKKFSGMASPAKQPGSSITCESLIRTRRMNKTESFLLEERLKVLDCKKNQKHAELNVEKHSLKKQIEEIRSVRKNSGISAERRKLLRSQGYTTDTRTALNNSDDVPAAFKRLSMPEMSCPDLSSSRSPNLNTHNSELAMKAFSLINIHGSIEMAEKEITGEEQRKNSSVTKRSRARHQFRVIEPPCRPGSRRNFVQLSNDKIKEFSEKEEKQSGEALFDPNAKVDHRGVILSPRLAKTSKSTTQAEVKADESPGQTSLIPISERQLCQDKQKKSTQSDQFLFGPGKQAWVENMYFENKTRTEETSSFPAVEKKLRSNSCDSFDRLKEVRASDSPSDVHNNESKSSRDVITPGSSHVDRKSNIATNNVHSTPELRRKQASTRPPARVAFAEPQEGMPNKERKSHGCVIESRQAKIQHVRNVESESRNSRLRADSSESNANEQTQLPREKAVELWKKRRVTVPTGKLSIAAPDHEVGSSQEGGKGETKRLSVASLAPNVRKKSVLSSHSEHYPQDDSVTNAYDARPGRSLCKGYVTMQMTVKGKQVKVHIPKFPHDSESEPAIERLRKKISFDRSQPRTLQEKETSNEEPEKAEA